MSLDYCLKVLDKEIEQLQAKVNAQNPARTEDEFIMLRAKSLGRTLLRLCQDLGATNLKTMDSVYQDARKRVFADVKDEIGLADL